MFSLKPELLRNYAWLVHQLDESNAGLAAIAAILIGLHLAVAALAASLFLRSADADRSAAVEPAT